MSSETTAARIHPLVFAFRLGYRFNQFHWHFQWCIFLDELAESSICWRDFNQLLEMVVQVYPDDSRGSLLSTLRNYGDQILTLQEAEATAEGWDAVFNDPELDFDTFDGVVLGHRREFEIGHEIRELLRDQTGSNSLGPDSFDLGEAISRFVWPQMSDREKQRICRDVIYHLFEDLPRSLQLGGRRGDAYRRWKNDTRVYPRMPMLREAMSCHLPPSIDQRRAETLRLNLGIETSFRGLVDRLRGRGFSARRRIINNLANRLANELSSQPTGQESASRPEVSSNASVGERGQPPESAPGSSPNLSASPNGSDPSGNTQRDSRQQERDRWIYNKVFDAHYWTYQEIRIELCRICTDHRWRPITTEQGIFTACLRYAVLHDLPRPQRRRRVASGN